MCFSLFNIALKRVYHTSSFYSVYWGKAVVYKRYMCLLCGFIYDEAQGWPEEGIAPGTRWADISDDWTCPECGARKSNFDMIDV